MVAAGCKVPQRAGGRYFGHKELPDDALGADVLDWPQSRRLEFLEGRRVKADYGEDGVDAEEARECAAFASEFLMAILGDA